MFFWCAGAVSSSCPGLHCPFPQSQLLCRLGGTARRSAASPAVLYGCFGYEISSILHIHTSRFNLAYFEKCKITSGGLAKMVSNKMFFLAAVYQLLPPSCRHSIQVCPTLVNVKYELLQNHLELEQSHIRSSSAFV